MSSVKCWCLVPMLGSRGPAARPRHTCSLWDTNTNANGLKISAGIYIIIVHSTITNVHSTGPIYKSRVCPHTFPECSVQCTVVTNAMWSWQNLSWKWVLDVTHHFCQSSAPPAIAETSWAWALHWSYKIITYLLFNRSVSSEKDLGNKYSDARKYF